MISFKEYITEGKKAFQESFQQTLDVLEEAVKAIDSGEYDYEGQMARTQLQTTLRNCKDLIDMIKDDDNMPEWVQSKITLAQDYITTVRDYLQSKEELGEVFNPEQQFDMIEEMAEELAIETELDIEQVWEELDEFSDEELLEACTCWKGYKRKPGTKPCAEGSCVKEESELDEGLQQKLRKYVPGYAKKQIDKKMDAEKFGRTDVDKDANYYRYKKVQDKLTKEEAIIDEAAVDAKGYKSSTGGLTQKGRDAYNRKEGSNLKAPVTTPPSKLKKGSKAANRRKSFCARMSGVEGPMKKPNGEPTRKALALRKWNC